MVWRIVRRNVGVAKRKSIAKNATPDPRSVEIPPVPAHWSEVTDPVSKRRAVLIWQDAHRLKIVGDIWQQWFRSLKAHGDADPIVPIRCRETIDRCLEVLWPYLTQIVPYLGTSLRDFKSRLPAMPSGRLADGEYPGWQKDSELWSSFYGDLNRGSVRPSRTLRRSDGVTPKAESRSRVIRDESSTPQDIGSRRIGGRSGATVQARIDRDRGIPRNRRCRFQVDRAASRASRTTVANCEEANAGSADSEPADQVLLSTAATRRT